ncbi:MAG: hypothetical protein RSF90_00155 [Pygmaiobacter sp.]
MDPAKVREKRDAYIRELGAHPETTLLENSGRCGVPISDKLMSVLKQLQNDGEKSDAK